MGNSYLEVAHLLARYQGILAPTPITIPLMMAIFWEESLFQNIKQEPGTAVGFGQVEPAEFWRFNPKSKLSALAKKHGYLVDGLPPVRNGRLIGTLTDDQAVKAPCAFVRDLFERGIKSKMGILKAYGGVGFTGKQPAHLKGGGRMKIIGDWLKCEEALKTAKNGDDILDAFQLARGFHRTPEIINRLFPEMKS